MNEVLKQLISEPNVCRCCLSNVGKMDLNQPYGETNEILIMSLQKYLGLTLATDPGYSHVICGECTKNIEEAIRFCRQVKLSEETYNKYWIQTQGSESDDLIVKCTSRQDDNRLCSDDSDVPISKFLNVCKVYNEDIGNKKSDSYGLSKIKHVSERKRIIITCGIVLKETTACPFRHHRSWFRCFFCAQAFMELKLLRDHTNNTHTDIDSELKNIKRFPRSLQIDISNLECRNCQLSLTDVESMRLHFSDVHNKLIYNECIADYKVDSSPYTCHICKREFHVFRTLTTHLNEHYANCICDVCGKSFLNSKRLKVHKRTHEDGSYPCHECGKILKTKTSKANHIESVHAKRVMTCHLCDKPMKHYNDRIKHMSEVHNVTHTFKCPFCARVYNIKHYLSTHIRQTHGNKNKKCTECNMAFVTNHGLKKHMVKHSGERPFSCKLCYKSYTRSYTLREHMREHEKCDS